MVAGGCVTTAECDEYVGCAEGEVCYQSRCLPECGDDEECGADELCQPCEPEDDEGSRCQGSDTGACVEE